VSLSGLEPGLDPSRSPPIRAVWRVSVGLFISLYGGLPGWMVGEMNEPGMRSPAGIARGQEPAWSLVSWLAVLAAQNGVCSLPGDPGSYQALTCRSRGCDSGGLTHRCHQRLHKRRGVTLQAATRIKLQVNATE